MKKQNQKRPMHRQANNSLFGKARILRTQATPAEKKLWEHIKGKQVGYKFRRQHPIGPYILDFYCHSQQLVIEVDGEYHQEILQQWQDTERTRYLEALGLKVIRFSNQEVMNQIDQVVVQIRLTLDEEED